jgi:hypothetical protein
MATLLNILFYLKRGRSTPNDISVIYTRITFNGKRSEFSTGRQIELRKWSSGSGNAKGNSDESKSLNRYLDSLKSKLYDVHDRLIRDNQLISAKIIRDIYFGKGEEQRMLVEIFRNITTK